MSSYVRWTDIRAEHVQRAGGEETVEAGKQELLVEIVGHRLAERRRARGLTQPALGTRRGQKPPKSPLPKSPPPLKSPPL